MLLGIIFSCLIQEQIFLGEESRTQRDRMIVGTLHSMVQRYLRSHLWVSF